MDMDKRNKVSLLNVIVKARTVKALDRAVEKSRRYQATLKREDKAYAALNNAGLSREQSHVVDDAISATNECGAAYGEAAYRMGLQDGIRLASEIQNIK